MFDMFALDVSAGKSHCVWYRGKHCLKESSLVYTRAGSNALRDMIKKAQKPITYFGATGIYPRVVEYFCETSGLCFCRPNPLKLHLKSESLRQVKVDRKDTHRIMLTIRENASRLIVPWKKDYLQLHELSRFYNRLNADWSYCLNHLHTALEQALPEPEQLFVNRVSKLALSIVELFLHPAPARPYSRVKLKNILMVSTDKRIPKMKACKYVDQLIDFAQKSYPATSGDAIQVDEVHYYARQLITLTHKREEIIKRMEFIAQRSPEYILHCSFPEIGKQTAVQLIRELGNINRFDNASQLNAFIGINIRRYQSGTYLGQDHISKRGNPIVRKLLYFTVGNMIRQQHANSNHTVDYYYRSKEKRPHPKLSKTAMVTYMNKNLEMSLVRD